MAFNKKAQLKCQYQDYLFLQARRLLAQMSPEEKEQLAEKIQARQLFNGEQIKNQEIYGLINRVRIIKEN